MGAVHFNESLHMKKCCPVPFHSHVSTFFSGILYLSPFIHSLSYHVSVIDSDTGNIKRETKASVHMELTFCWGAQTIKKSVKCIPYVV